MEKEQYVEIAMEKGYSEPQALELYAEYEAARRAGLPVLSPDNLLEAPLITTYP